MAESDEQCSSSTSDKRPQFGQRYLEDPNQVFEHNAWDNIVWDNAQESEASRLVKANAGVLVDPETAEKYKNESNEYWNKFYDQHQSGFFKDRHWLFTEFPELAERSTTESEVPESNSAQDTYPGERAKRRILEIGCGVGNTVFPILETNNDPRLFVYCCDISQSAIDILKNSTQYDERRCHAFVSDVSKEQLELPFPKESLDIITMIFVLSAIDPSKFLRTMQNLVEYLKPGGVLLFRDYGKYDLAQLRFKKGRCMGDNYYVRGDGTTVYFFTQGGWNSKTVQQFLK